MRSSAESPRPRAARIPAGFSSLFGARIAGDEGDSGDLKDPAVLIETCSRAYRTFLGRHRA